MRTINNMRFFLLFIISQLITVGLNAQAPKREFRAVWITSVLNLDWPSANNLSVTKQKKELIGLLDSLHNLHFNAVFFQVRPCSDALYKSNIEPWSRYLSEKQGAAPTPMYDPLQFAIDECQKREIDLHAWINPFRLKQKDSDSLSENHIAIKNPDWIIRYGHQSFLDPGNPEVQKYVCTVVQDIASRYNIRGIHFDDYFYPYPISNVPYPDSSSFQKYGNEYYPNKLNDWRRNNINTFIKQIKNTLDSINPQLLFGVSPFGVWRNFRDDSKGSMTQAGVTTYDHLYADALHWIRNGLVDYLSPQIYWEIGHPAADYITLANWWNENNYNRHIYIGHALYKAEDQNQKLDWKMAEQLPEQIEITRNLKKIQGNAFFRTQHLLKNPNGFCDSLKNRIYQYEALPPIPTWKNHAPPPPVNKFKKAFLFSKGLKWKGLRTSKNQYLLYYCINSSNIDTNSAKNILLKGHATQIKFKNKDEWKGQEVYFGVSVLDEYKYESEISNIIKIKF